MEVTIDPDAVRVRARRILTEREFAAWELRERHGMSLRGIAMQTNRSVSTIREQLHRADQKLRAASADEFLPPQPRYEPEARPASRLGRPALMVRNLLAERDGARCYLCQVEAVPSALEVDHIIPRALGGTDDASNLALACPDCNARKVDHVVSILVSSGRPVYHPHR